MVEILIAETVTEDFLPDSRTKSPPKNVQRGEHAMYGVLNWAPIFCANCGKPRGYVIEDSTFANAFCLECAERWQGVINTLVMPEEVFWTKFQRHLIEKYGHELTPAQLTAALQEHDRQITQLINDRHDMLTQRRD